LHNLLGILERVLRLLGKALKSHPNPSFLALLPARHTISRRRCCPAYADKGIVAQGSRQF
jgi:hypothetical protein